MSSRTRWWRHALPALAMVAGLTLAVPASIGGAPSAAAGEVAGGSVTVTGLQANGRTNPLGIPGGAPSLSWKATSSARGVTQSAYQVRVASSEDELDAADVWDSGKVVSDEQADVVYGGPALTSHTRYVWQVRTWNGADESSDWSAPASFETGLLDAADWDGADWIGGAPGTELNRWSDYTADIDFDIDKLALGVFIRAKDTSNAYMWQISTADGTGVPKFRPHKRVGNNYSLLDNEPITSITSAQLLQGTHRLSITVDGSTITTKLDGTQIDQRTDTTFAQGFIGFRQDFANDIDESADIKAVKVTAKNGDVLLDTDFSDGNNPFNGGTLTDQGLHVADRKDVLWRSPDANLPLLRTDFSTEPGKTVAQARVYASAYGVYQLQLNGQQVGDQFLAPGWTDYSKRIQHQTYDVTDQVKSGDNAFGAELGEGWWTGKIASFGGDQYGTNVGVIALLRIDYTDGTHQVVSTDPSWKSHYGPFVQADNIDGESYDANAEQTGWDEPGYDAADWAPVVPAPSATARLVPQPDEPVRVTGEIPAVAHTTPTPGVEIYDLGQNMVGVARLRLQGQEGKTVRIRYGEELNPDGTLYTANLRTAQATDHFTFKQTGTREYTPTFTQHGFRYIEVTGTTAPPALADVTGVVWGSDLTATGDLKTSDPMLNQLVSNISWGQRGNFLSIPTDTPARDERLGWTGDINVFAPTASYLRDTRAFLEKWTTDLRDAGYGDGNVPGIAPVVPKAGDFGSGLGWSDAAITVPYATWKAWDDDKIVRENYSAMSDFLAFVRTSAGDDLIDSKRGHWEDWLNLDDPTGVDVLGTAYYAEDARMLSEMAASIGKDDDAADFAALSTNIRKAFTRTLVAPDGTVEGNSQAGYAMALGMNMISDPALREKVAAKFVAKLATSDYHLTTGFLGTPWLLPALSSIGRDDLAYKMLLQKDYPSWGYEIAHGSTTMWERWNSIMPDGSFGDVAMNSFNHYAYGAVGDWMYQHIGGIKALEAGYKKIEIKPSIGGGLTHGSGHYDSAYGAIDTDWRTQGDDLSLKVDIPVNTTAEVVVPAENAYAVTEGGSLLGDVDGITDVTAADGNVTVTVGSGHYDFQVTQANARLGSILEAITGARSHVGDLAHDDDLTSADADHLDSGLAVAGNDVTTALLAVLDQDQPESTVRLQDALDGVQGLRAWLTTTTVDESVRTDLDGRLASIEAQLVRALTASRGIRVALPPVATDALPGSTLTGTVEVTNSGAEPVTGLEAEVSVDGWGTSTSTLPDLEVGQSAQLPVTFQVPRHQAPGTLAADLELRFTVGGKQFTLTDTTADWVTVTSGLAIGAVTATMGADEPVEHATLEVPVTNSSSTDVVGHLVATLPSGWKSVPSDLVTVPAGGTVTAEIPVVVPLDLVAGPVATTVELRQAGATLVSADVSPVFSLATPPATSVLDHVDFGDGPSEQAHGITASASSGTNSEAGYTRRYANAAFPGAWYSVAVNVTPHQPFVLRDIETFDTARTKRYNVYVDGTLVKTQLVPRTATTAGTEVYDLLVDDRDVLDNDGTVRVKFEYPTDPGSFFDPSIADLWVLGVPDDSSAPDVSATVTSGVVGDGGWFRSDATVAVDAADDRDDAPAVETSTGDQWLDYVGPITVAGEGHHIVSYRATDASDNVSPTRTLAVDIDETAPHTTLTTTHVWGAGQAALTFDATDALSGVAQTAYRIDGGEWRSTSGGGGATVTGYGDHVVDFASTDVAGNPEPVQTVTVTLVDPGPGGGTDADTVQNVVPPQIGGTAAYGATLTATSGSWNTTGLSFGYQWLRDGSPVTGATARSLTLGAADLGHRMSVRVTASKSGWTTGSADSTATAAVDKAGSSTEVSVNRTRVKAGHPVTVTVVVRSAGTTPTGKVVVRIDGRAVKTVSLGSGRATARVDVKHRGKHRITAVYAGSATVDGSMSAPRTVRAT